jgi:hypothetical protein
MKEAGINTIRVYAPITEVAVLDQIDAAGIKVIVGFGYNQDGNYDILSGYIYRLCKSLSRITRRFCSGNLAMNTITIPSGLAMILNNWYHALNDAAGLIHKTDPSHPVATAHGELPDAKALFLMPECGCMGNECLSLG